MMTSQIDTTILVRTPDKAQERLKYLHDTLGLTWREISSLDDYRGIPAGSLCSYAHGAEPKKKHRQQLGLPPLGDVIYLYGYMPTGEALSIGAIFCECGQLFISNHPARKRCFICSPWRKHARTR
jgi:hypothetical protein